MDTRSEFGKAAGELAKDRFARLSPEEKQETIAKMIAARKLKHTSMTPEEKQELVRRQQQGRLAALADKRARGEKVDHLSPETRKRIAKMGGVAAAAKKFAHMTPEERKELGKNLPAARHIAATKRQALGYPAEPSERKQYAFRDRLIELPRTVSRKSAITFCKLISDVDAEVYGGFGWRGIIFRPGQRVPESALWPDKSYPATPLCLECAGRCSETGENVYVLWQLKERKWIELGRAQSMSWEWAVDLRPLAVRALARDRYPKRQMVDLQRFTSEISTFIETKVARLPKAQEMPAYCILHDWLAGNASVRMRDTIPAIALRKGQGTTDKEFNL